jgi:dihydrofolate synthase/folylpolyglutamate synthase
VLHDVVDRTAERLVEEGDLPWHPSFFEMLTAMAFEYFARSRPDMVVLEVGMGGRLDATNVVDPRLSIITDIALDHQKYLGETVAEIAREKAGIIRPGGVVVTLPQLPEANDVIGNTILDVGARAVNAVPYVPPVSPGSASCLSGQWKRYPLEVMGTPILVESPLVGAINCATSRWRSRRQRNCTTREFQITRRDHRSRHPPNALAGPLPGTPRRR